MASRGGRATALTEIVAALKKRYGRPGRPPTKTLFELLMWDLVAYLAPDDRRAVAFAALKKQVGLTPRAICDASPSVLREIARLGGSIAPEERVEHMQDSAAIVLDDFDGSIENAAALPPKAARKALRRFRGVGEPGAERFLMFAHREPVLALESNGLRVLGRIGYGRPDTNYTRMYRSVQGAAQQEARADFDWLIDAHLLLRRHGQETCKTSSPRCEVCPVSARCAFANRGVTS